jgi:hypothetical protein
MVPLWSAEIKREGESRITWEIEPQPQGEVCRLTVTHAQIREGASEEVYGGWPMMLSSLKSLLETGQSMDFQPPAVVLERWQSSQDPAQPGSAAH